MPAPKSASSAAPVIFCAALATLSSASRVLTAPNAWPDSMKNTMSPPTIASVHASCTHGMLAQQQPSAEDSSSLPLGG